MKLPLIIRRHLAWQTALHELEIASERSEPIEPTASQAALALAGLFQLVDCDPQLLEAQTARVPPLLISTLHAAAQQLAEEAMHELQALIDRVGDDPTWLQQPPAWTNAPASAAKSQLAMRRVAAHLRLNRGLHALVAAWDLPETRLPPATQARLSQLSRISVPLTGEGQRGHLTVVEEGAETIPPLPAQVLDWVAARVDGDRLRLTAEEAKALLTTERGLQLADYLSNDVDISAAVEAIEAKPLSVADVRRAWLRGVEDATQRGHTSKSSLNSQAKRSLSRGAPLAFLRAAANHLPVLAKNRPALFWAAPLETWVFPELGILVAMGVVPAGSREIGDKPALLVVHAGGLQSLRVADLSVDQADTDAAAVSVHVGDLTGMPSVRWQNRDVSPESADRSLSLLLQRWLEFVHADAMADAADLLGAIRLEFASSARATDLLNTIHDLSVPSADTEPDAT